ncbi:MAG: hypothetical protein ACU0BS_11930, partial [Hasllibacter sp.]
GGGPAADADLRDDTAPSRRSAGEARPDVDEINASLRPAAPDRGEDRGEDGGPSARRRPSRRRRGFRAGFIGAIAFFVVAALVYGFAPEIGRAVPGAAPGLESYADWVTRRRAALDRGAREVAESLSGLAGG